MYTVEFYEYHRGVSELWDFLASGSCVREITGYSTSVGGVTVLCCCTSFGRDRKKHRGVKLNEQKRNVMIGLQERVNEYEDLERL